MNKDDCLTQCIAQYANREDHTCNDMGYDTIPVPIFYCEAGDGEDLGAFLAASGTVCLSDCISAYPTRSGHMCNDVAYGHLFSTYYCEAGLGENLATIEAVSAADCVVKCASLYSYSARENFQCNDVGYDHLPIPIWYCEASSGEDIGTYSAATTADCVHQCTTIFPSKIGHTCSTGGYSTPWLTWTGGPGGGYCSRVTWFCEAIGGTDLGQFQAFDAAQCLGECNATFPSLAATCNDVGYDFDIWYCEVSYIYIDAPPCKTHTTAYIYMACLTGRGAYIYLHRPVMPKTLTASRRSPRLSVSASALVPILPELATCAIVLGL